MRIFQSSTLAAFAISTVLAAPLFPIDYDLSARDHDVTPRYAARGGVDDDYKHFLVARSGAGKKLWQTAANAILPAKKPTPKLLEVAKQIRTGLKTKPNEAIFWSGSNFDSKGEKVSVMNDAQAFAAGKGKSTLEMKLKEEKIDMPPYKPEDRSPQLWRMASKKFASGAKGEVEVVKGQSLNAGNIYTTHEKHRLEKNPAVTKITEHVSGEPPHVIKWVAVFRSLLCLLLTSCSHFHQGRHLQDKGPSHLQDKGCCHLQKEDCYHLQEKDCHHRQEEARYHRQAEARFLQQEEGRCRLQKASCIDLQEEGRYPSQKVPLVGVSLTRTNRRNKFAEKFQRSESSINGLRLYGEIHGQS